MAASSTTTARPAGQRPNGRGTRSAPAKVAAAKRRIATAPPSRDRRLGRFEGMREAIRALLEMDRERDFVKQFLVPPEDQRTLADRLGVPLYFVALLGEEDMCREDRYVAQEEIDEWEAWRQAYPEVA